MKFTNLYQGLIFPIFLVCSIIYIYPSYFLSLTVAGGGIKRSDWFHVGFDTKQSWLGDREFGGTSRLGTIGKRYQHPVGCHHARFWWVLYSRLSLLFVGSKGWIGIEWKSDFQFKSSQSWDNISFQSQISQFFSSSLDVLGKYICKTFGPSAKDLFRNLPGVCQEKSGTIHINKCPYNLWELLWFNFLIPLSKFS